MTPNEEFHLILNSLAHNLIQREQYRENPFDKDCNVALWYLEADIYTCYEALTILSNIMKGE